MAEPELVPALAEMSCAACGTLGVTVIALDRAEGGGMQAWCGVACAETAGWPWLEPR